MRLLSKIALVIVVSALTACGGGGGSPGIVPNQPGITTPPVVSPVEPPSATPASIELLSSASTVLSGGAEVVITAVIKSATNVGMAGQMVEFEASSGSLLAPAAETNESGIATVRLTAGGDKANRDITVTVRAGTVSESIVIPVTGTRVTVAGATSMQVGGAPVQYSVRALDSTGAGITDATIQLTTSLGNALSAAAITTDKTGAATFIYTPNLSGTDTLGISGMGASAAIQVLVSATDFTVSSPAVNTSILVGADQLITVRYRNDKVGVSGQTVTFTSTRGSFTVSTAVTDANGEASATLWSPTAGPATVSALIAGIGQVTLPVQFVATTPATLLLQANPGAVLPNPSGTANQSTLEALVRDADGNPVANRLVTFTAVKDLSNGQLSPGSATTDANGRAQVQFISGANSTPADDVILRADVASTSVFGTTSLTVNGQALFINLGFGNTIANLDETIYSKPFSVYVTDATGNAVGNQRVVLSVIPSTYGKGSMRYSTLSSQWVVVSEQICDNEDNNLNGVLDAGEDENDSKSLTPGNVVVAAPGAISTDSQGRASFSLQYGEQYVPWITLRLIARASVGGTESSTALLFKLPGLASDFTSETNPPAGVVSPFGQQLSCTVPN